MEGESRAKDPGCLYGRPAMIFQTAATRYRSKNLAQWDSSCSVGPAGCILKSGPYQPEIFGTLFLSS